METTTQKLIKAREIICQRCGKKITEPAFVLVRGEIINRMQGTMIYTCPEQMFNFDQKIILCAPCWIETLRDHQTEVYDLKKVIEAYNEKAKK